MVSHVVIMVTVESGMEHLFAIAAMITLEQIVLSKISVFLAYALTDLHVLMVNMVIHVNVRNGYREKNVNKPITVPVVLAKIQVFV